jgi:hypothetical protein
MGTTSSAQAKWYRIYNHVTKAYYTLNGHVQQFTSKPQADQFRNHLIKGTGQKHTTRTFYPPTVGNPHGGKIRGTA